VLVGWSGERCELLVAADLGFDTNPTTTVTRHLRSALQLSGNWTFDKPTAPSTTQPRKVEA